MRQHAENHDDHFNGFRREYFMLDLFPENDRRFPLTLADCLKDDREESQQYRRDGQSNRSSQGPYNRVAQRER